MTYTQKRQLAPGESVFDFLSRGGGGNGSGSTPSSTAAAAGGGAPNTVVDDELDSCTFKVGR